jgi:GNAT superfamily N-acetyltransferase
MRNNKSLNKIKISEDVTMKSLLLSLCFLPLVSFAAYTVDYKKASEISPQQWKTLEESWIHMFCTAYNGLSNEKIDKNIRGKDQKALALWLKEQFADYRARALNNEHHEYALLYGESGLAGYAMYALLPKQSMVHVHQVGVLEYFQGKDAGKALLNAVADRNPNKSLVLTTRILNTRAQAFYKHLGFYQLDEAIEDVACDFSCSVLLRKDY